MAVKIKLAVLALALLVSALTPSLCIVGNGFAAVRVSPAVTWACPGAGGTGCGG